MRAKIKSDNKDYKFTAAQVDLISLFRMLWEQHDTWTTAAITSLVFGLPNTDAVINRLLRNPVDFEQALLPYYGQKAAAQFRDLLTAHLAIAADLVRAAKAGDNAAAMQIESAWYQNANAIAAFLAGINPYWSQEQWRRMMHTHLALVKAIAVNMLTGQYDESIAAYDRNELHTLDMADVMAAGVIRQFDIK
jgi:hypothetical protein